MIPGAEKMKELKAAVLAIEWEITDSAMDSLIRAIKPLQEEWVGRKTLLVCLQVIGTLGQYIKKARGKAHPAAIKLLPDVFATLETVTTEGSMEEEQKVALIRGAVEKYNRLKTELARPPRESERESPPIPVAGKFPVTPPPEEERGGGTIKELLDQKEDQSVNGAFNAIFQEMVSDDRQAALAVAPGTPPIPSVGGQIGPETKEVVLAKVENEEFPEADSLLDDFFSEDGLSFSPAEGKVAAQSPISDDTVEVDIGQFEVVKEKAVVLGRVDAQTVKEEIIVDKLARIIQNTKYGISPSLLSQLAGEVDSLRSQYPGHGSLLLFLEIIDAVCSHLALHDDVAVDLSISQVQTAYDRLAHSLFTMQPQQKLLASHLETVQDFGKWHEQVVAELTQRAAVAAGQQVQPGEETKEELPHDVTVAVKSLIRREMEQFRRELLELIAGR